MRIVYPGVLGAVLMKPISAGGFWMGFFSLAFLVPFIMGLRGVLNYIRLKKHGIKTYAVIFSTRKVPVRTGYHYDKFYSYSVEGKSCGGMFTVGYKAKRYADKQKIEIRYDAKDPQKHIRVRDSLWESIAVLFLTSLFFLGTFVIFLDELLKCF